jgi:hypothetical protein
MEDRKNKEEAKKEASGLKEEDMNVKNAKQKQDKEKNEVHSQG